MLLPLPLQHVCGSRSAHANNQHTICLDVPLEETPFFKAMRLARGTISIADEGGVSTALGVLPTRGRAMDSYASWQVIWTRIWW